MAHGLGLLGHSWKFELLGVVLVEEGLEVGAAAGFVEAGGADDDELLALAEALGVDGGLAADHADGGELGDFVGEGHEDGDGAEGLVGEGGVEAGEDDAFAEVDEFHGEVGDCGVEELDLVEADDVDFVDVAGAKSSALRLSEVGVTTAASWVWELWLAMAVRW